jgi:CysZ protein
VFPILCNLVLTAGLIAALWYGGHATYAWLLGLLPDGAWWWTALQWVVAAALVVVLLGLTLAGWLMFQGILCGFFYSRLAREVEIQLGMNPADIREVPLWYQVVDAVLDLVTLTAVSVGCLALSFVPVLGAPAAFLFGGYFNCFVFGMEYLDYPQALRAYGRKAQREFARRHRAVTLGLGASVTVITFVPVLNSILLTTAVTGAVLLYRRLEPMRPA